MVTARGNLEKRFATQLEPLQRAWRKGADRAIRRSCGHSLSLLSPIIALHRHGDGQRHGALAEQVGIEAPSLVRLVSELESLGFVERRGEASDGRAKTINLTDKGRRMGALLEETLNGYRAEILKGIPAEDLETGLMVIERMATALERFALRADQEVMAVAAK